MKYILSENNINYDGSQLSSHWIADNFDIFGDGIVAFSGSCDVSTSNMVDLEDLHANAKIESKDMLHFIAEHFDLTIRETVLRQRLLICIIKETLEEFVSDAKIIRKGDDLFEDDKKITISVATKSAGSGLIHTGINISSEGTPVKTKGLSDFKIDTELFAKFVLERYSEELKSVLRAAAKVRWV